MVHRNALNKLSIKRLHYNAFKLRLAKKKQKFFYECSKKREQRMFVIKNTQNWAPKWITEQK